MLLLMKKDLAKLDKLNLMKRLQLFTAGAKVVTLKEFEGAKCTPLNIMPEKEIVEAVKSGAMSPKKAAKAYMKMVKKENIAIQFLTVLGLAFGEDKIPVIVFDDENEESKLVFRCIYTTLRKYFGVKPFILKDIKKVLKGKKKAAKRDFIKLMNKFTVEDEKKYDKVRKEHRYEILSIALQDKYISKDGRLNKELRARFGKKLQRYIADGKKPKKEMKKLERLLKIKAIAMPKAKKLFIGKCDPEDLVIAATHMAAVGSAEFASKEYFDMMGEMFTSTLDTKDNPMGKMFKEAVTAK